MITTWNMSCFLGGGMPVNPDISLRALGRAGSVRERGFNIAASEIGTGSELIEYTSLYM